MGTGSWPALVGREREKGFSGGSGWAIRAEALREPIHRLCVLYLPTRSGAAMLQGFFTLYYLVKNVPSSKVFFRFCKESDWFCIYLYLSQNYPKCTVAVYLLPKTDWLGLLSITCWVWIRFWRLLPMWVKFICCGWAPQKFESHTTRVSHIHSLSMLVDMLLSIMWGKFLKMTYINENLIQHWFLIFDFITLINFKW